MIDLYEKKLKAEIKKIKAETKKTKKKWHQKPDFILKSSDIFLKFLIFIASVVSVFYISNLYDIKNERLELKRDKLEIQVGFFEKKKDSLYNENFYLSKINDSVSNSNNNLLNILTRLQKDSIKQIRLIAKFRKQIGEIENSKKSEDLQKTLDKIISNSVSLVKANAGEDMTICLGESIKLRASGGETYLWSTGEATKSINVKPTKTTYYTVKISRGGVTSSDTLRVTVENCSNSSSNSNSFFNLYPNPTNGFININIENSITELNIEIMNLKGIKVYSDTISPNQGDFIKKIDLSKFSKGVYIIRLFNDNKNITKKILLN